MLNSVLAPVVGFLLPMLAGFLTTKLMDVVKLANGWLDKSPALVKRLVVMAVATLMVVAGKLAGVELDPSAVDPNGVGGIGIDNTTMQALVAGILSLVLHNAKKITEAADAPVPPQDRAQPGVTSNVFDTTRATYDPGA